MGAWQELSIRENGGLVVSLLWHRDTDRVKVVLVDSATGRRCAFPVSPDRALDAFHHPFLYAGPDVHVGVPLHREEVVA
jgi:hypothetical protein